MSSTLLAFAGLAWAQTEAGATEPAEPAPIAPAAADDAGTSSEAQPTETEPSAPAAADESEEESSEDRAAEPAQATSEANSDAPPADLAPRPPPVTPTPAPAPAPVASSVSLQSSAPLTEDSAPAGEEPRILPPFMGLELFASALDRISDSAEYQEDRPTDMGYGAGLWYEGGDRLALGASYEYTGLGEGKSKAGGDYVDTEYRVHGLWVAGRAYPYRSGGVGVFATAGVGMTFMRLSASGTRPAEVTQPSEAFLCSGGTSPNLAFAGGAGVNLDVGTQMAFLSQLGAAMYRGTSDFVDGCAPGLGSPVAVGLKVGFAYYFGV